MAWEWVGTVAVGVVGVAGVAFTWLTSKQGRDHTERLNKARLDHERQLAAEARTQARLERAYLDLLEMVEVMGAWVQMVKPVADTIPPRPLPDVPTPEAQIRVRASIGAFGTDTVAALHDEWLGVVREVVNTASLIEMDQEERGMSRGSAYLDLEERLRPAEREKRAAMVQQVSRELRLEG